MRAGSLRVRLALAGIGVVFVAFQAPLAVQLGANAEEVAPLLRHPPAELAPDRPDDGEPAPGLLASEGLPVWSWVWGDGSLTPLMVDGHVGALSFAPARSLAAWFGLGAARLQSTVLGLLGLLAIFAFARRVGGDAAGLLAAALAAISAQYAFAFLMLRPDEQLDSLALLAALLAFLRHHDTGRVRWFYAGCLAVGVALMAKNTALWVLLGIGVGAGAFRLCPRARAGAWAAGAALAAVPLLPQLAYVLSVDTGGAFAGRLQQIAAPWEALAPDHLLFSLRHFDESFGHMGTVLAGYTQLHAVGPLIGGVGYGILAAVMVTIAATARRSQPPAVRAFGLGCGVTLALYWLLYYRGASYYLLLAPWVPIAVALAVVGIVRSARPAGRAVVVALLVVLAVSSIAEAARMIDAVRHPETGMFDGAAQRELAALLEDTGRTRPYSTTYGAVGVYELLSRQAVRPRSLWPYFDRAGERPADFQAAWAAVFARLGPGTHTLLLSPNASPVETSEGVPGALIDSELAPAAAAANARIEVISVWRAPSGHAILRVVDLHL